MKLIKWFWVLTLLTTSGANAAFVGENVAGYGDGYVVTSIPGEFTIYSSNLERDEDVGSSYLYTDLATHGMTVSFNWSYQTFDEDGPYDAEEGTGYFDPVGYVVNGVKVQLNQSFTSASENGIGSFFVASGSTFGFYADTADNGGGRGALTISSLEISAVPEPQTYALVLFGLGLISLIAHRKHK